MKKTIIKCAIVGGIIVFIVNCFAWRAVPMMKPMHFQNENAVSDVLKENAPADGVYVIRPSEKSDSPYFYGTVKYHNKHCLGMTMALSLIGQIVIAGLITWLLLKTKGLAFGQKVGFITVVGVIIAISSDFTYFNWAGFPLCITLFSFVEQIVAWFLAGYAMTKLMKK
ncbi:MAG: hypothetical protein JSR39_05175 [Verrucomicrobia bacterium]|nr:hypothetical protein [Verrucomicrobiota bacterium]